DSNTTWWTSQFEASTPDAIIQGLDAASDGNAAMDTFLQTLRDNPAMASALQKALANEGSDLLGEIEKLAKGTNSQFSLESLNAVLATEGGRNLFTNALTLVGEDTIETRHFEGLMAKFHGTNVSEGRFLAALDPSKAELERIIDAGGSPASLMPVIAKLSPDKFIEAVGTAYPEHAEMINMIKSDSHLVASLHNAIVKDPTMLEGLQGVMSAGTNSFNAADLKRILADPMQRDYLRQVLDKVADGKTPDGTDITFTHVRNLFDSYKEGNAEGVRNALTTLGLTPPGVDISMIMNFMTELMENPELAVNNLVNGLISAGAIPADQADLAKGGLMMFAGPMKEMVGPYHQLAVEYDIGMDTPERVMGSLKAAGASISERYGDVRFSTTPTAGPDGLISTDISAEQFKTAFTEAMEGKALTEANILAAAAKADARFADETIAITRDSSLSAMFKNVVDISSVEAAANSLAGMREELKTSASDPALATTSGTQRLQSALTPG
ncbi:MAG: hypothetical protein AAF412_03150, partial [Pseudomonadota bacterium]